MALAPLIMAIADSAISVVNSSIDLAFSISLPSACRYSPSSVAISLRPCVIFSLVVDIACSVFDELETGQRAVGHGLIRVDDECVGERCRRLILRGDLLRAEFNRRKLRFGSTASEIVELVTQHGAAACELVLRHQRALALDLENVGKDFRENLEFPGQPRNLIE